MMEGAFWGEKIPAFLNILKKFFRGQIIIIGVKPGSLQRIRKELLRVQAGIWGSSKKRQFFNLASSLPVLK